MSDLTDRQKEIQTLVAEGYSNKQVAQKLGIHVQTVKNQLRDIYNKAGVSNRTQLALKYYNIQ